MAFYQSLRNTHTLRISIGQELGELGGSVYLVWREVEIERHSSTFTRCCLAFDGYHLC